MTNEEVIKALRVCGQGSCGECLMLDHNCGSLCIKAADAIEDLQQLADNIEKERRCLEEEVHRLNDGRHRDTIELACKNTEVRFCVENCAECSSLRSCRDAGRRGSLTVYEL